MSSRLLSKPFNTPEPFTTPEPPRSARASIGGDCVERAIRLPGCEVHRAGDPASVGVAPSVIQSQDGLGMLDAGQMWMPPVASASTTRSPSEATFALRDIADPRWTTAYSLRATAAVGAFLCSEQASFTNGANYRVDFGAVASI